MKELINGDVYITPSEVIEYLFCPRFTYFMNCLCIPQNEEKRFKVLKGREIHDDKTKVNRDYLRKKINCINKEILVYMCSKKYHLKGEVDEVLTLKDGTMAPLDYKYAEYQGAVFKTHKIQATLYALLIKDNYNKEVNKGYICYIRSKNLLKEINFTKDDFIFAEEIIIDILKIIHTGYFPKKTRYPAKCIDCCYKNICV